MRSVNFGGRRDGESCFFYSLLSSGGRGQCIVLGKGFCLMKRVDCVCGSGILYVLLCKYAFFIKIDLMYILKVTSHGLKVK